MEIHCFHKKCFIVRASVEGTVTVHQEIEDGYMFDESIDLEEVASIDVHEVEIEGRMLDESAHKAIGEWLMEDYNGKGDSWIDQAFYMQEIDMDSICRED